MFFIDRPIFATVLSGVVALAGGLALLALPVAQYPAITPPQVIVVINYPGASARVVADTVAAPVEQQVNGVERMLYMSSTSGNDGSYTLSVTFEVGTHLNAALVMVQNRVQLAMPQLPTEVQRQGVTVRKRTPDILQVISFTSPDGRYDDVYLSNFATIHVKDELLRIEGVSDINILGRRDYALRVWLDPGALAARGLTAPDVAAAVRAQNVEVAAGRVGQPPADRGLSFQWPVAALGRLADPEQFGDIVVRAGRATPPPAFDETAVPAGRAGVGPTGGVAQVDLTRSTLGLLRNPTGVTGGPAAGSGRTTTGPTGGSASAAVAPPAAPRGGVPGPTAGGTVGADALAGGALADPPVPSAGVVRLRDVARIELGAQAYDTAAAFDGRPSVGLGLYQLPGTNALDVADAIRAKMAELKPRFPDGVEYHIAYDTTPFIRESVRDVVRTLFEAVGLVGLVVLLFLQNWRAAVIPLAAVPVSVLGTFAVMAALGFSLNTVSLFGLVLSIGIVVDDAIVVVENVERWLEEGYPPREAARRAMAEVTGPVVAIAVVLCAVFVPCAVVGGIPGRFFRQFAVTITASTVLSAVNSLTLSPALAALLMRKRGAGRDPLTRLLDLALGRFFRLFNRAFEAGTGLYARGVGRLVRGVPAVLVVYGGLLVLTARAVQTAPTGFVPQQDQGRVLVSLQLPDSASLARTEEAIARVTDVARDTPGVAHVVSVAGMSLLAGSNGPNFGSVFLVLDPFDRRQAPDLSADAVMARVRAECAAKVRGADVKVFGAPAVPGLSVAGGFKVMVQDRGGLGLGALQQQTDAVVAALRDDPAVVGAGTQFRSRTPQFDLDIDRAKAQALGVSPGDLDQTVQTFLGSLYANNFDAFGRHWQVTLQADGRFRNDPADVGRLQVRNKWGEMVPLGTLVRLREVNGPAAVVRYNMYPAAAVAGTVSPRAGSGRVIAGVDAVADRVLPRTMSAEWTELFFLQIRAGNTAVAVFLLAAAFAFLALAALYESWAMPLAVVPVVPLCLLGSVGGVLLAGTGVDVFVQIGLVVLVGLACKNAILIVEFAQALRRAGMSRHEAAVEASRLRLRPILMTSLAFILGVLPLAVATGAGAEMRRSLGVAVLSGMLGVTLFGVLLTPVFFALVQRIADRKARAFSRSRAERGNEAHSSLITHHSSLE